MYPERIDALDDSESGISCGAGKGDYTASAAPRPAKTQAAAPRLRQSDPAAGELDLGTVT